MSTVLEGWRNTLDKVPAEVKPYFQFQDNITAQNGLLFKGEHLIVSTKLRKEWWKRSVCPILISRVVFDEQPGMNAEFKDFILKCNICSSYKPAQPQELLMPYEIPSRPWQKVGTDLILFDQRHYLITVEYYSSFFEVGKLNTTDSRTVIEKLKM